MMTNKKRDPRAASGVTSPLSPTGYCISRYTGTGYTGILPRITPFPTPYRCRSKVAGCSCCETCVVFGFFCLNEMESDVALSHPRGVGSQNFLLLSYSQAHNQRRRHSLRWQPWTGRVGGSQATPAPCMACSLAAVRSIPPLLPRARFSACGWLLCDHISGGASLCM